MYLVVSTQTVLFHIIVIGAPVAHKYAYGPTMPGITRAVLQNLGCMCETSRNVIICLFAHLFVFVPVGCVALLGAHPYSCAADDRAHMREHLRRQTARLGNVTHNQLQTAPWRWSQVTLPQACES